MAIVWPCPIAVDAYAAAGRDLGFPRPDCPSSAGPLVFWSGYRRYVREAGRYWKIFVPRLRCARCGVSHALLPAFTLAWRLDVAETIGSAVGEVVAGGGCGVRPAAQRAGVPYTTARGWVRRFRARAAELGVAVELGGQAVTPPGRGPGSRRPLEPRRTVGTAATHQPGTSCLVAARLNSAPVPPTGFLYFTALSCSSRSDCTAVGTYQDRSGGGNRDFAGHRAAGVWGRALSMAAAGASQKTTFGLPVPSCASAGNCAAGASAGPSPLAGKGIPASPSGHTQTPPAASCRYLSPDSPSG